MKKLMMILAVVTSVGAAAYLTGSAAGQNASKKPPAPRIGVIDLEYVFKNYEKFKVQSERIQAEFKEKRDELALLDERIKQLREEQKSFNPSSAEYQQRDNDITQRSAELRAQAEQAQKEFARRDATLLRNIYGDIQEMVRLASLPKYKNLNVVLQTRKPSSESGMSLGEIQRDLSRLVIHHDDELDITEYVLFNLNNRFKQAVARGNTRTKR